MHVCSAEITFSIAGARSLKDKRQVRRSMMDRARQKFNISIAEVDAQDALQRLVIGIAVVSGDASHAKTSLHNVIDYLEGCGEAELVSVEMG